MISGQWFLRKKLGVPHNSNNLGKEHPHKQIRELV